MTNKLSVFEMTTESAGLLIDVQINGIPLSEHGLPVHLVLNEFLLEGANTVSIDLRRIPGYGGEVSGRVDIRKDGAPSNVFVYPPPLDPPEPLPHSAFEDFDFDAEIGPRAWENATPIEESAGPPPALIAFLQQVGETMAARDVDGATALFATSTRERAKVYGLDPEEQLSNKREYFASLFRDPFFGMEPIEPDSVQIRCGADGRFVFVRTPFGGDPLHTVPDAEGITSYFPLSVSLVNGNWTIIR